MQSSDNYLANTILASYSQIYRLNMINHNDVIKEYKLMKNKYSIYALEYEWLQYSGILYGISGYYYVISLCSCSYN